MFVSCPARVYEIDDYEIGQPEAILKKSLFPVQRPGGYFFVDWELFVF